MMTPLVDPEEREMYHCAMTRQAQRLCAPYVSVSDMEKRARKRSSNCDATQNKFPSASQPLQHRRHRTVGIVERMRLRLSNTTNHIPLIPVIAGYMELVGGKRRQRMTNNRSTTDVESCRTSSEVREHSNCGRISGSRCVLVGRGMLAHSEEFEYEGIYG
ncbi:hypothetical protein Y032_0215g2370 [Ancylostoma ceylanicum]|uniref:Uncharacterized protein n=1 Tax=Ancylostoma ceylanicum TaxID=53326 RepID=A0A016SK39_9BILA|nr:hypothetical protein Y032_0215g2370 [Ancylostoma ceylanicum]